MASHNVLGSEGELLARKFLEEKGFKILEVNWRYKKAEVDLIAFKDLTLIFLEVKTRSSNYYGQPDEFVNYKKRALIELAADEYIYRIKHNQEIRFDIISILFDKFGNHTINHIEDAFWPGS